MIVSVILAAGEGKRMKSTHSKVSTKILNRPMISYIVEASRNSGADKTCIIVGQNKAYLEELFEGQDIEFLFQEVGPGLPYGTGYAASLASPYVGDEDHVLVLTGDIPLITADTLKSFIDFHKEGGFDTSLITAEKEDPFGYGRIVKDENNVLKKIVEQRDASPEELEIKEFNPGIYIFSGDLFKKYLQEIGTDNDQGEYYITDMIEILSNNGKKIGVFKTEDNIEVEGVNSKDQLFDLELELRKRVNTAYMKEGVLLRGEDILIEPGVKIGRDTEIFSGARIFGKTEIGERCTITGDSYIEDSIIGDDVIIKSSYIEKSKVEDGADMGPFAHLRPNSHLKEKVHIGNFVEVKNASLGKGTKAGHLAYIGDADLGEGINIGCGAIFVNYDGKNKHRAVVEDGAFIGSNSNVIAPLTLKKNSYIAAGSTVTTDVEEGALFLNRAESRQIEKWVYKKKLKEEDK